MATIINRGPFQFQAIVRKKGYPTKTQTFETKTAAKEWASLIESEMNRGTFADRKEAEKILFEDILNRYKNEVIPNKRGFEMDTNRINKILKHDLAKRPLSTLRSVDFSNYRDNRLKEVKSGTVLRELSLLSHVFSTAKKDWSIAIENPIATIRKPKQGKNRERRLQADEGARLQIAANDSFCRSKTLDYCIQLAMQTGMRAGEIVSLTSDQVDLENSIINLSKTKNGSTRIVPLTIAAEQVVRNMLAENSSDKLTSFHDSNGLSKAFRRACARASIKGLCFHDLRHEAASRLAPTMSAPTLAKVMGWKTIQMAMRYYNPTARELVSAIRGIGRD